MKKFITFVAMQPEKFLLRMKYEPQDNDELKDDREVYFPVSVLVESYAAKNETVELLCLMEKDNEDVARNIELLQNEIDEISAEIGFRYHIRRVMVSREEHARDHLTTFSDLINFIEDGDELYTCCTYGTKPIPIIEMMALNFAYQAKDDVSIKSIVYGKVNRDQGKVVNAEIYDITGLFFMTQIVNRLAGTRAEHPAEIIRDILNLEE